MLSSLIALISRLLGRGASPSTASTLSPVQNDPPPMPETRAAETSSVTGEGHATGASPDNSAIAAAPPLPAGAAVAASAPTWLDLCRPLTQFSEHCYLTAYPDPGSPLGKALQARGIWQKVLNGMSIPNDAVLLALSGAPWTCGWGQTGSDVKQGTVWTQEHADARLEQSLAECGAAVDKAVTVPLTPAQKAAVGDTLYNVGPGRAASAGDPGRDGIFTLASGKPSTLLALLNVGNYTGAAAQFAVWNKSGGVVMSGLVARRARARDLFLTGTWSKT